MIKLVPFFPLMQFSKNKGKSLVAGISLVTICSMAYPRYLVTPVPSNTPASKQAKAIDGSPLQHDVEVAEVIVEVGTLSRLWSDQNNITAVIKNNGTEDQVDVTVELNVTGANSEILTQVIPSLAAGASTTISFTASVGAAGSQTVAVKVPDDDDNTNNTKQVAQEITCNTYAYTGTEPIYDGFGFGSGTGIITARYQAPGISLQFKGVTVHLSNNSANIGKSISGVLLDDIGNIIAESDAFYATASDLNTNIQLNFFFPVRVNPGDVVYAGVRQDEPDQAPVGTALPVITPANRYFTFPVTGGPATHYTTLGSLKIGVITDVPATLNHSASGQIMAGTPVTFTATPGFSQYTFTVNGSAAQSSPDNVFTYYPSNNDNVHVEISFNGCTSAPIGDYLMDVKQIVPDNNILYVNKNNPVPGDGSSWANALTEVADALRWAKTKEAYWTAANPLQIWVAGGTYNPLYSPADDNFGNEDGMNNAFLMVKNVKLYGGFAGTETHLGARDLSLTANRSILSGDYNNNDVITGIDFDLNITGNLENACHIVIASGDVGEAVLDGFTVTGGGGDSESLNDLEINGNPITKLGGGGLHNYLSSPVYSNLIIKGNKSPFYGGGVYNDQTSSPVFTNVLLVNNLSEFQGGGMLNANLSTPVLTNVTISNNNALVEGGGYANISSNPIIRNSIVYGNSTGYLDINSTPVITYTLVEGLPEDLTNHNPEGSIDPQFTNPSAGNFILLSTSPFINAGNNQYYQAGETPDLSGITKDLAGKPRLTGSAVDLGAFESRNQDQTITASDLYRTYGDADFELTAVASSGLPVSYALPDTNTVRLYQDPLDNNKWKIKIKKAGAASIIISQPGDATYDPAPDMDILLVISRKELVAKARDTSREYGADNPVFAINYTGFAGDDDVQDITAPNISTTATKTSAPGTYPILLSGGDAENYDIKLTNGTLTIAGAIITIHQQPAGQSVCSGSTATLTTNATASMSAPLAYQWQQSTDSTTWNNIAGADEAQLITAPVSDLYYRCVLTTPGRVVNSDAVKLLVKATDKPVINLPNVVCLLESKVALSASLPGGVFSGAGVIGNTWHIDTLRPGNQNILYAYTNNNGCVTTVGKTVNLSLCGEKDLVTEAKVQPNPTNGLITVKALLTENARQSVVITNSFGQQVLQKKMQLWKGWNQLTFDLTGFSNGIYFITITGNDRAPATVIRIVKR